MEALYLLALGFVVGLSGALMPGPLLVYTIAQSMRKGALTGFFVILGHAMVEVALMVVLAFGVNALMTDRLVVSAISLIGGAYMAYSAWNLRNSRWDARPKRKLEGHGLVAGGILFTAFNPGFPVWWATAGSRLLLEGIRLMGVPGAALVLVGHWVADFGWYMVVSALAAKGREKLIGRYVDTVKNILALLLLLIGAYFISTGL